MDVLADLSQWVLSWGDSPFAWAALFVVSFWDSSFFPVPPDGLLIVLALADPRLAIPLAGLCTLGSLLGAALGYWIGLRGGRPLVDRFIDPDTVSLVEAKYQQNDTLAILLACLTPLPYKVFAIGAGMCRVDFRRFMVVSLVGRSIRFLAVGTALLIFGEQIRGLVEAYTGTIAIGFILLMLTGVFVLRWYTTGTAKSV